MVWEVRIWVLPNPQYVTLIVNSPLDNLSSERVSKGFKTFIHVLKCMYTYRPPKIVYTFWEVGALLMPVRFSQVTLI